MKPLLYKIYVLQAGGVVQGDSAEGAAADGDASNQVLDTHKCHGGHH